MRGLHEDELVVYAGSYAPAASESVYVYRFNKQTGSLTLQQSLSGLENPSFLTLNGKQNRLYAVSEAVASDGKVASY